MLVAKRAVWRDEHSAETSAGKWVDKMVDPKALTSVVLKVD